MRPFCLPNPVTRHVCPCPQIPELAMESHRWLNSWLVHLQWLHNLSGSELLARWCARPKLANASLSPLPLPVLGYLTCPGALSTHNLALQAKLWKLAFPLTGRRRGGDKNSGPWELVSLSSAAPVHQEMRTHAQARLHSPRRTQHQEKTWQEWKQTHIKYQQPIL